MAPPSALAELKPVRRPTYPIGPLIVRLRNVNPLCNGIEGIDTDGPRTVKFNVETTAKTPGRRDAVVAALNEWVPSS